jgi:hypothetical protein
VGSVRTYVGDRPPMSELTRGERTEPGTFEVKNRFLYSPFPSEFPLAPGQTHNSYFHGGDVVASDWAGKWDHENTVEATIKRATASFGDDVQLVVTVALKNPAVVAKSSYNESVEAIIARGVRDRAPGDTAEDTARLVAKELQRLGWLFPVEASGR